MPLLQNEVTKRTMNEKRQVAIIHYNTPELTEAAILSLRKHGGEDYEITVCCCLTTVQSDRSRDRWTA